ncbi:methyl-accepting chemotaxis protein [Cohnella panacarvi]|uniref:methyl-accepting chemotaxis protein n=1 Tax=Cohnella panacarvi TaxID=400776 RepID=UPI00047949CE|nr:methyl-accepting chemotaxis protein [Cohnella panacarvi]
MTEFRKLIGSLFRSPARSIGTKLFLIFVCAVCLSVGGLGWFASSAARSGIIDELEQGSVQTVSLAGEKLDMQQLSYLNLALELVNNSSFLEPLFQITNASIDEEERKVLAGSIQGLLDQLALSDSRIRDITLFPLEDELPPISTIRETGAIADAAEEPWMRDVVRAEGKEVWLPTREKGYYGNAPKPLFAYGKLLGKKNIGSRDFALVVQIEASVLGDLIKEVRLSDNAETQILDAHGRLLATNFSEGTGAGEVFAYDAAQQAGSAIREGSDGRQLWTAYRHSPISGWTLAGVAPLTELTASADRIRAVTTMAVAGCAVVALLVGLWLVRMIGSPLRRMESLMNQAADGLLTGRMRVRSKNELGQVAEAYNRMMENLGRMVGETLASAKEVASSSQRLSEAASRTTSAAHDIRAVTEQIAQGAINLASGAERGIVSVESMGERLKEAYSLQARMAGSAMETGEACRRGGAAMEGLVTRAEATESRLRKAGDRIVGLKEEAGSVRGIVELMDRMSKQIRILSLNASIEATRAGAAGAGFKVIAEEIRKLAERSDESIASVGTFTESIEGEVEGTFAAMEEALPFFRQMLEEIGAIHLAFGEMSERMEQLGVHSAGVEQAIGQLNDEGASLATVMGEVSAIAQQSTAASEEAAHQCSSQTQISEQLLEQSRSLGEVSDKLALQMRQFRL